MTEPAFLQAMRDPITWVKPDPLPPALQTDRLIIRPFVQSDALALFNAVDSDRPQLIDWLPWARTENKTEAQCLKSINDFSRIAREEAAPEVVLGMFDRNTGELVGGSGFHDIHPHLHDAEIGYWLHSDHRGKGLCTEAVRHLITWGFTPQDQGGWGFRRIVIFCAEANAASARVPQRIGLRLESRAVHKRYLEPIGYHTELSFGILASEWERARHAPKSPIRAGIQSAPHQSP